jgi:hypothetical protein
LWSTFFTGHTQTLIATLSAGALTFAATNIQKKLATIMILMEILNHIAKRLQMEAALVGMVQRDVDQVRCMMCKFI